MTPWQKYKQSLNTVGPWDLLNPNAERVEESVANNRYEICLDCAELTPHKRCNQCGCFMNQKVKLLKAECPIGKW